MKAWRIDISDCDTVYVLAPTRDKATAKAINSHPEGNWWVEMRWYGDFSRIKRQRMPELDGDQITHQQLCEMGYMWTECYGCEARIGTEATPRKFYDQFEWEGSTPRQKPDADPRYLTEETTPYWPAPWTAFCCKACFDDHPELHRSAMATGYDDPEAVYLSTDY